MNSLLHDNVAGMRQIKAYAQSPRAFLQLLRWLVQLLKCLLLLRAHKLLRLVFLAQLRKQASRPGFLHWPLFQSVLQQARCRSLQGRKVFSRRAVVKFEKKTFVA
jgi:hypothetical protein